jgi:hypothetical protein
MIAHVGDRIVVEGTPQGGHRRVGVVTAVDQTDGGLPYLVHWPDDGRTTLIFPRPEVRIESATTGQGWPSPSSRPTARPVVTGQPVHSGHH